MTVSINEVLNTTNDATFNAFDRFLQENPQYLTALDDNGQTPLHVAVQGGDLRLIQLLIQRGARLDEVNRSGDSALRMAAKNNDARIVQYLVKNSTDLSSIFTYSQDLKEELPFGFLGVGLGAWFVTMLVGIYCSIFAGVIAQSLHPFTGNIATNLQMRDDAAETTGLFILATNDLSKELSMQFILDEYKSQQAVERGFRFLKSPDFLTSSLFLKKPERIESLLIIMTCSLMVYPGIEHLIRAKLVKEKALFPDMKNKPTQRPTARWVFFCFQGISLLVIDKKMEVITNIIDRQKIILDVLGRAYWRFYS